MAIITGAADFYKRRKTEHRKTRCTRSRRLRARYVDRVGILSNIAEPCRTQLQEERIPSLRRLGSTHTQARGRASLTGRTRRGYLPGVLDWTVAGWDGPIGLGARG
jgi:hypothetical protein